MVNFLSELDSAPQQLIQIQIQCQDIRNHDITIIHGKCNYVTMYYSDDRKSASWER